MNIEHVDEMLAGDYAALADCIEQAGALRAGYWSPFSALAWIASGGDQAFVAGVQLYEIEAHSNRGSEHSAAAIIVIGNVLGQRFGVSLTGASGPLREALESGSIAGVAANQIRGGGRRLIERHEWTDWRVAYIHEGITLLPGLVDFRFPSEQVIAAFPPLAVSEAQSPPSGSAPKAPGYRRKSITPEQKRIGLFLGLIEARDDGSLHKPQALLHETYRAWNNKRNNEPQSRRKVPAAQLSTFKRWAKRYLEGERWLAKV